MSEKVSNDSNASSDASREPAAGEFAGLHSRQEVPPKVQEQVELYKLKIELVQQTSELLKLALDNNVPMGLLSKLLDVPNQDILKQTMPKRKLPSSPHHRRYQSDITAHHLPSLPYSYPQSYPQQQQYQFPPPVQYVRNPGMPPQMQAQQQVPQQTHVQPIQAPALVSPGRQGLPPFKQANYSPPKATSHSPHKKKQASMSNINFLNYTPANPPR